MTILDFKEPISPISWADGIEHDIPWLPEAGVQDSKLAEIVPSKVARASKVGHPCDRNIWYAINGEAQEVNSGRERIFDVGTALEPVIVGWLRQDGWDVRYNPGSQIADLELKIPVAGGVIAGHPDCFISRPGQENVLVDIKTMNDKSFTEWKRNGTLAAKPQYIDQVHVYGEAAMRVGFAVEKLGIVGINKNNSEMYIDVFDFELERIDAIVKRAERLFAATEPPESGNRMEGWCCSCCEYAHACDLRKKKNANQGDEVVSTTDPAIIDAMTMLQSARNMGKTSEAMENEAKSVLETRVLEQGIKTIRGGALILSLTEVTTEKVNTKRFKAEHPEMAAKYITKSPSVRYSLKEAV